MAKRRFKIGRRNAGLARSELRQLWQLEEENKKLEKVVTELSLGKPILQDVIKKALMSVQKRAWVRDLSKDYEVSARKACRIMVIGPSLYYHKAQRIGVPLSSTDPGDSRDRDSVQF